MIIVAGPCQLESYQHGIDSALYLKEVFKKYPIEFVFKTSFDKANRTSKDGIRGAGLNVLSMLFRDLGYIFKVKRLTDIHEPNQANVLHSYCDVFQIPALLSRQTDLIAAAGNTNRIVNIKKGQFMSPHDMKHAVAKAVGASEVWLTERGTTFGYNNLVVDFRSLVIMREENPNAKIIFDCTHSTQLPGAMGNQSGGERKYALPLAKAAIAVGVDGLFLETHHNPAKAPSDGPLQIPWTELEAFIDEVLNVKKSD